MEISNIIFTDWFFGSLQGEIDGKPVLFLLDTKPEILGQGYVKTVLFEDDGWENTAPWEPFTFAGHTSGEYLKAPEMAKLVKQVRGQLALTTIEPETPIKDRLTITT